MREAFKSLGGMNRPPAVVLGGGAHGLGAYRSLGRKGIRVFAVHSDASDPALSSRFCHRVISPDPKTDGRNYLEFLVDLASRLPSKPVLIPTGDTQVLLMSRHRERLQSRFHFKMAAASTIEALIDKRAFFDLAQSHGLPVPRPYVVGDEATLRTISQELTYPCLIKPAYSASWADGRFQRQFGRETGGWIKRIVVPSREELLRIYPEMAAFDPNLIIQEYIDGGDDCLYDFYSYLDADSEPVGMFLIQKIRTLPIDGNGVSTCAKSVWDDTLAETSLRFLKAIRYQGNSMVCFKRSARTGRFYCIEVNARQGVLHNLATYCGVDLLYMAYEDAIGERRATAGYRGGSVKVVSFWDDVASFRKYRERGDITLREWIASLRGKKIECFWSIDDPRPFLLKSLDALFGNVVGHWRVRRFVEDCRRWMIDGFYYTGLLGVSRAFQPRNDGGLLILMYHHVGKARPLRPDLYVSEDHFEKQVRYLTRRYRVLSLEEAVEGIEWGKAFPKNTVVVTFDDGFRDNYEKALPILKKYRCPATVFVTTGPLEGGGSLWQDRLAYWFGATKMRDLHLRPDVSGMDRGPTQRKFDLATEGDRRNALCQIESLLRALEPSAREALLTDIAVRLGFRPDGGSFDEVSMLTEDQLRAMAEAGITIGCHTRTHPVLTTLDRGDVMRELRDSKGFLEQVLNRPISFFAYPFGAHGDFNSNIELLVEQSGYRAACSAIEGVNLPGANRFALRRLHVQDDPASIFALKLLRAFRASPGYRITSIGNV